MIAKVSRFSFYLMVLPLAFLTCQKPDNNNQQPNIIVIMADDMGYSDLGCFGSEISTPNLDNLAYNGVRFTQFYNTAKCFTTRAEIMSGLYAFEAGMGTSPGTLNTQASTLGYQMKSAGYRTLMSGKWHGQQNPYTFGFDRYYGLVDGAVNFWNPGNDRPGEPIPGRKTNFFPRTWAIDSAIYKPYTPENLDFYMTDAFTNHALEYLEEYKNDDKPFFLHLTYTAPHYPLHAWPEDIAKYRGKYKDGWFALREKRFAKIKELGLFNEGLKLPAPHEDVEDWESLSDSLKDDADLHMAVYAAMVDRLDQNIGRLLDKLEEIGQADNTIIMFLSDNGACAEEANYTPNIKPGPVESYRSLDACWANATNTPFRKFKNHDFEGGICTPFIYYDPRKPELKGQLRDYPGHLIDIMPTMLELSGSAYAGADTLKPLRGKSLLPALDNENLERETPLYFQWSQSCAIRMGDWKLVSYLKEPWHLYNLAEDRNELNNLAAEYPEMVLKMDSLYSSWVMEVGAKKRNIEDEE